MVDVTDPSDIARVMITFDTGDGNWQSFDLSLGPSGKWEGEETMTGSFRYLVQAVDAAGNVAFSDDKGVFFTTIGLDLEGAESESGCPGSIISLQHTITNTGGGMDTFVISAESSKRWVVETPPPVALLPGKGTIIELLVRIPVGATEGVIDEVRTEATSVSNPMVSRELVDTVRVQCWWTYLPMVLR